jgi:ABC-type xylose transport system permease subunit
MEGRLLLWMVIISVTVRTESAYGREVFIVGGDKIGHT